MSRKVCTCGALDQELLEQQEYETQPLPVRKRPEVFAATGEVYVFIRAPDEYFPVMKNYMVRESKIIENYHGKILGLADTVDVVEGGNYEGSLWPKDYSYCMMVIQFDSFRNATLWSYCDPIFKQQDYLPPNNMIDGFIVPLKHLPPDDCRSFALMSVRNIRDPRALQERFIDEVAPILDDYLLEQGVVSTHEWEPLRRCWLRKGDYVFVHKSRNPEDLRNVFRDDRYKDLRGPRDCWADVELINFTVSPDPLKFQPGRR